ncbi:MAG: cupredoxin domain-containing protein [Alicyclobacillus sp.]|nr:cupredoxin domain-containing protein [Alicyclobacillus sp.]
MRKQAGWWVCGAVLGLVAGCGGGSGGSDQVPANAQTVHVEASNWKWTLDKTTFKAGVPIDFKVQATEGAHGFAIAGTNVSQTIAQGQAPVDKVWTPDKPGTYTIYCDQFCGSGHDAMHVQITVTP